MIVKRKSNYLKVRIKVENLKRKKSMSRKKLKIEDEKIVHRERF